MAQTAFKGSPVNLSGDLPKPGAFAPDFTLTGTDLSNISLKDYAGKTLVLNIFPSIDTPTCAMSVRKFNAEIGNTENAVVLCVSADLPFAHSRFCGSEGLEHVVSASTFRSPGFGDAYGMRITDGPLAGLMARAVLVIDGQGRCELDHPDDHQRRDLTGGARLAGAALDRVGDADRPLAFQHQADDVGPDQQPGVGVDHQLHAAGYHRW